MAQLPMQTGVHRRDCLGIARLYAYLLRQLLINTKKDYLHNKKNPQCMQGMLRELSNQQHRYTEIDILIMMARLKAHRFETAEGQGQDDIL
jgi:hypothetical protein